MEDGASRFQEMCLVSELIGDGEQQHPTRFVFLVDEWLAFLSKANKMKNRKAKV